ncbi:class I SAM-dependent methyltransferase [Sphingomonas sp. URHD0057]|uniref:class I SAM-dependent methyltransferase n=1 Tax=Sphingomonas sp. URHD0057 TaxID=1380389 RepID=UPI0009E03A8F|nr:methyltransferase domain-containing protein [Sphingomonas sp. URHD0057]
MTSPPEASPANLVPPDSILADFVCPRCRAPLEASRIGLCCTDCLHNYPMIEGQPVLVDFATSILDEDEVRASGGASNIRRGSGGLKRRLVQALLPQNRRAETNAQAFLKLAGRLAAKPRILIVGGGSQGEGTASLYAARNIELIAFDIYASTLTQFIADAHRIPLADASVDAVWIQAVLEHVLDPWAVVGEIDRVLKPAGIVYAETPFLQHVHEGAYDFTRFTESGHRWLFRKFELIDSGVVLGAASQLLWSIEHVVRGVTRSVGAGIAAKMAFFWLRYLDRLIPPAYASDAASAVFFLGRKSGQPIGPRDMLSFYRGAHPRRASQRDKLTSPGP